MALRPTNAAPHVTAASELGRKTRARWEGETVGATPAPQGTHAALCDKLVLTGFPSTRPEACRPPR